MKREPFIACSLLAAAVGLSVVAARLPSDALPRSASGDGSALSVAFGDARKVISQAMLQKADSYFHGGVEMGRGRKADCEGIGSHDHDHDHHDHQHGDGCGCGDCHEAHGEHAAADGFWDDPFAWVNERVRAPRVDRHLDNERSVELVPLVWASVKADPHNLEGWGIGWFVLAKEMKRTDLAWNLLEEGLKENPGSPSILMLMGSTAYANGKGDQEKAEGYFRRAWQEGMAKCGGDPERLDQEDEQGLLYAINYLSVFCDRRGDAATVEAILADARKFRGGTNFVTVGIAQRQADKGGVKQ